MLCYKASQRAHAQEKPSNILGCLKGCSGYLRAEGRGLEAALPTSLRLVLGRRRAAVGSMTPMDWAAEEDLDRLVRMPLLLRRRLVNRGPCAVAGLHARWSWGGGAC